MAKIEYKVELVTPAVTAKSGTIGKELDVTVKRNIDGQSYYSAKHIKGILKSKVMEFKNALDEKYDAEKVKEGVEIFEKEFRNWWDEDGMLERPSYKETNFRIYGTIRYNTVKSSMEKQGFKFTDGEE